jgi:hypothetical protein
VVFCTDSDFFPSATIVPRLALEMPSLRGHRSRIRTARGALDAVESGRVGIAGSTATVVKRSLSDAEGLLDRLLEAKPLATIRDTTVKSRA